MESQSNLKIWIGRQFPATSMALIPVGVALNISIGTLVQIIKLPVFLDSIGTVLVSVLGGTLPGIATGVLTVLLQGLLTNPIQPFFAGTAIAIGWFSGYCANRGAFRRAWVCAVCGLIMGVICAMVSAPMIVYLFGGITQSGSSLVVAFLMASGESVLKSVVLAGIACDPVDKLLTFLAVFLVLRGLPRRLRSRFAHGVANTEVPRDGV